MIIAFTGKKQSGKSTICEYLEQHPRGSEFSKFKRVNFKDALITELITNFRPLLDEMAEEMHRNGGPMYGEYKDLFVDKPPLVRKLMQCYGTEVRRGDDPQYWIKQWKKTIFSSKGVDHILCDDVRFHNEAQAVRDCGGVVIRIVRTDIVSTDNHQSEAEMDEIIPDYTITVGKGDYVDLYSQMDEILLSVIHR